MDDGSVYHTERQMYILELNHSPLQVKEGMEEMEETVETVETAETVEMVEMVEMAETVEVVGMRLTSILVMESIFISFPLSNIPTWWKRWKRWKRW